MRRYGRRDHAPCWNRPCLTTRQGGRVRAPFVQRRAYTCRLYSGAESHKTHIQGKKQRTRIRALCCPSRRSRPPPRPLLADQLWFFFLLGSLSTYCHWRERTQQKNNDNNKDTRSLPATPVGLAGTPMATTRPAARTRALGPAATVAAVAVAAAAVACQIAAHGV